MHFFVHLCFKWFQFYCYAVAKAYTVVFSVMLCSCTFVNVMFLVDNYFNVNKSVQAVHESLVVCGFLCLSQLWTEPGLFRYDDPRLFQRAASVDGPVGAPAQLHPHHRVDLVLGGRVWELDTVCFSGT